MLANLGTCLGGVRTIAAALIVVGGAAGVILLVLSLLR